MIKRLLESKFLNSDRHIHNPFMWILLILSVVLARSTYGVSLVFAYYAYVRMFRQPEKLQ